jgi:quinol monooxygenase YgiN
MLVIVAKLKAKEGKEAEMEKALLKMFPQVREKEEGTLSYIMHKAKNDPRLFLFYEKYRDQEAFNLHSSTPYFKELFATIGPLMEGNPTVEMYEEIEGITR